VANFSEGRRAAVVDQIASTIVRGHGVALLHRTSDTDHNRSVLTFAGEPESVVAAAVRAVATAASTIDLTQHQGVHPRLGAADVVPFVPVEGITLAECADLARRAGQEIWETTHVPVYFYEAAATRPQRVRLEDVRRGGFEGIWKAVQSDPAKRPDIGGPELHPTAGAAIVGARKILIAWNVNLAGGTLADAQAIARRIRQSSGGFPAVKAIGLPLASRHLVQVSVNLTDFEITPLHSVYEAIVAEAAQRGLTVVGSEIIGLMPAAAIENAAAHYFRFEDFHRYRILERRIDELLPLGIEDIFDLIASPARATGGGSAAAAAAAMAAALGMLVCRLSGLDGAAFADARHFFAAAIARDAEAFAAVMKSREPEESALVNAAEAPLGIAARARSLHGDLDTLRARTPGKFISDVEAAIELARAAVAGSIATARANLLRISDPAARAEVELRLAQLQ
jgi:glutamate formiminotransferase